MSNSVTLAPLSVGFSRQECWSGLPCPPPGCTYYSIFKVQGGPKGPHFSEESLLSLLHLEKTGGRSVELVTHCVRRFCPVLSYGSVTPDARRKCKNTKPSPWSKHLINKGLLQVHTALDHLFNRSLPITHTLSTMGTVACLASSFLLFLLGSRILWALWLNPQGRRCECPSTDRN